MIIWIVLLAAWILVPLPFCFILWRKLRSIEDELMYLAQQRVTMVEKKSWIAESPSPLPANDPEPEEAPAVVESSIPRVEQTIAPTVNAVHDGIEDNCLESEVEQGRFERLVCRLREWGFLPPIITTAEKEAALMQWWAPRLGGVLAIISAVFFAIYMGQHTAAWVRFLELCVASAGVSLTGFFLKKRHSALGEVILAIGLALVYFTSVAAYAAPPVRVISSAEWGGVLQLSVFALIMIIGLRNKAGHLLLMAQFFGGISALFGSLTGLREPVLLIALMLSGSAVVLFNRTREARYAFMGVGTAYFPVAGFIFMKVMQRAMPPAGLSMLLFLSVIVSLFFLCGWLEKKTNPSGSSRLRWFHTLNSVQALGLGYCFFKCCDPSGLTLFYGTLSLVYLAWAGAFFLQREAFLYPFCYIKGASLASLWLVTQFEGEIRWVGLFLQFLALTWSCAQRRNVWLSIYCVLVWCVALGYLLHSGFAEKAFCLPWALKGCFPLLTVAVAGADFQRLLRPRKETFCLWTGVMTLLAWGVGLVWLRTSGFSQLFLPLWLLGYGMLFLLCVPLFRSSAFYLGGSFLFFLALASMQFWWYPRSGIVLLCLLVVYVALLAAWVRFSVGVGRIKRWIVEGLLHLAWMFSVVSWVQNFESNWWNVFIIPSLATGAVLLNRRLSLIALADLSLFPLFVLVFFQGYQKFELFEGSGLVGFVLLLALLPVAMPQWIRQFTHRFYLFWMMSLLGLLLVMMAIWMKPVQTWWAFNLTLLGLGCVGLLSGRWRRNISMFVFSWALLLWVGFRLVHEYLSEISTHVWTPWPMEFLSVAILLVSILLIQALWVYRKTLRGVAPRFMSISRCLSPIIAYFVVFVTVLYGPLPFVKLASGLLGSFCLGIIALGLYFRMKELRVIGLLGLVIPLMRLFLFDIRNTVDRILAFGLVAGLLLLIGYLYAHFQKKISMPAVSVEPKE
jgi:hypothetical protein